MDSATFPKDKGKKKKKKEKGAVGILAAMARKRAPSESVRVDHKGQNVDFLRPEKKGVWIGPFDQDA